MKNKFHVACPVLDINMCFEGDTIFNFLLPICCFKGIVSE